MAVITGTPGDDSLEGTSGSDTLEGLGGNDFLWGGDGLDYLQGGTGNDTLDGSLGFDFADHRNSLTAIVANLATRQVTGEGTDTLIDIEGVIGSPLADKLTGDAAANWFLGMGGVDTIDGGDGADVIDYSFAGGAVVVDLAAKTVTGPDGSDVFISIEGASGTSYNDQLLGDDGANRLRPRGGDDIVDGRGGFDTVDYSSGVTGGVTVDLAAGTATGGGGNDMLTSIEAVLGSGFADTLLGSTAANRLEGGGGDDLLGGRGGQDTFDGGAGFDYVSYSAATASVNANLATGQATVVGTTSTLISVEAFYGGSGADLITGDANTNFLRGNGGDDTIEGGAGNDIVDYGAAAGGVFASLAEGRSSGGDGNDALSGLETVYGSEHDDVLEGDAKANLLRGRGGNDVLRGGDGADTLRGDAGNDTLEGGNNTLWFDIDLADYQFVGNGITVNLVTGVADAGSDGMDTLVGMEGAFGGAGNDLLVGDDGYLNFFRGGLGDDTIQAGDGYDIIDYQFGSPTGGVTVDLAAGTATGGAGNDQLTGIESVWGTAFADLLIGGAGDENFRGNAGNDTLRGGGGQDSADYGGASGGVSVDLQAGSSSGPDGNDVLESIEEVFGSAHADLLLGDAGDNGFRGGLGNDTIDGRSGTDTVSYTIARGAVTVNLAQGTATGADGNDALAGIENVLGGLFDDLLVGDAGANWLRGDDSAFGGAGDDTLSGGGGDDTLEGAGGTDTATWSGAAAGHRLGFADGAWTVTDLSGAEGADTVLEVERLQFADRTVIVEERAHGGYDDVPEDLWHFFIVAFDAAPGVTYMDQLAEASRFGMSVKEIVDVFTTKPQFTEVYPATLDEQALAEAMVENIVKDSADAQAKLQAVNDIVDAFGIGWTVGDVVYRVFGNLATKPLDDPQWGGTARQFLNQVEVAKHYTEVMNQSTTDLPTLRSVIDAVTPEADIASAEALVELVGQGLLEG
jgi:Ca2+-binding RTX toxin-like protein